MVDQIFEPNLGVSDSELKELHQFAEGYREQLEAEREQYELQKRQQLEAENEEKTGIIGELKTQQHAYGQAYKAIGNGNRRVVSVDGGNYEVVEAHYDRLRMAITSNPEKQLRGYLPTFEDISDWQEVTLDVDGNGNPIVKSIYYWNKPTLDSWRMGGVYWGIAQEISFDHIDQRSLSDLREMREISSRVIKVPGAMISDSSGQ